MLVLSTSTDVKWYVVIAPSSNVRDKRSNENRNVDGFTENGVGISQVKTSVSAVWTPMRPPITPSMLMYQ